MSVLMWVCMVVGKEKGLFYRSKNKERVEFYNVF